MSYTKSIHFPMNVWEPDDVKEWCEKHLLEHQLSGIAQTYAEHGFITVKFEERQRLGRWLDK